MPVLKVKNNGTWEEIMGGSGSGQMNGGNADTLDGKTAAYFENAINAKADYDHSHSAYVNQNAFSNVKVGTTTISADSTTDTLTLVAGNNITLTPDTTNDKITISATGGGSSYTHPNSGVAQGSYNRVTVNAQGHVTAGENPTTLAGYGITNGVTSTDFATYMQYVAEEFKNKAALNHDHSGVYAPTSHSHSTYVNQNAFSNVKVGTTTIAADSATDTLTLVAGSNVTLTPNATSDQITIAATDTVYTHPSSGVTAGTYNSVTVNAQGHVTKGTNVAAYTHPSSGVTAATYKSVTVNAQGHVTSGSNPNTLSGYGITDAYTKNEVSEQINNALANFKTGKTLTEHLTEENMILSSHQYGTTLPPAGIPGRIFFLKV